MTTRGCSVSVVLLVCGLLSCGGAQPSVTPEAAAQMSVRGFVQFDPEPDDGGRDTYTILRTAVEQCGNDWLGEDVVVTLEQWSRPNEILYRLPDGATGYAAYCMISHGCGRTPQERAPGCGGGVECITAHPHEYVIVDQTARAGYSLVSWRLPDSAGEGTALVLDCDDERGSMAPAW